MGPVNVFSFIQLSNFRLPYAMSCEKYTAGRYIFTTRSRGKTEGILLLLYKSRSYGII